MERIAFFSLSIIFFISCSSFHHISEYNNVIVKDGETFFYNNKARLRIKYFGDYDFKNTLLEKYDYLFIKILNEALGTNSIKKRNILSVAETNVDPIWQNSIILLDEEYLSNDNLLLKAKCSLMKENGLTYYEKFAFVRQHPVHHPPRGYGLR